MNSFKNITQLIRSRKKIIFLFFFLLSNALALPSAISLPYRLIFILYAGFIFWILFGTLGTKENILSIKLQTENKPSLSYLWSALLIGGFIFLILSRIYMFARYGEAPLGYDTGFYMQFFNLVTNMHSTVGVVTNRIAYTSWFPFFYLGLSPLFTIMMLHVSHQIVTWGAMYFFTRSFIKDKAVAAVAVFLFAISLNQFMTFWWMFYKQSMALPFILLSVGLFVRRSWLFVPIGLIGAMIHLQTSIAFVLACLIFILIQFTYCAIKKITPDREIITLTIVGLLSAITLIVLKGPDDVLTHLHYITRLRGLASNAAAWEVGQAKGLFIPFSTFRLNTMFYLPFALLGIMSARDWLFSSIKDRKNLLLILLFVILPLVSFPFLYQNRSLIILDIVVIIFAAWPLVNFIKQCSQEKIGSLTVAILGIGILLFSSIFIWNHKPQVYAQEIAAIRQIKTLRQTGDYAMVLSAVYTPWVYAFTGFEPTIVPGWLTWDKWDLNAWHEFWFSATNERRLELLRIYGKNNIYLFIGLQQRLSPSLREFIETDPHFEPINQFIWRFTPYLLSEK